MKNTMYTIALIAMSLVPLYGQVEAPAKKKAEQQKTYILTRPDFKHLLGRSITEKTRINMEDGVITILIPRQEIKGSMSSKENKERLLEYISENEIRIHFIAQTQNEKTVIGGAPQIKNEEHPIVGMQALLKRTDGQWKSALEKGELTDENRSKVEEAIKDLADNFNNDDAMDTYGDKPRSIGQSWKVPVSSISSLAGGFDDPTGAAKLTLDKIKEVNGELCAFLTLDFDIQGKMKNGEMKGGIMNFQGTADVVRSLILYQDKHVELNGVVSMKNQMEVQPGVNANLDLKGEFKMIQEKAEQK